MAQRCGLTLTTAFSSSKMGQPFLVLDAKRTPAWIALLVATAALAWIVFSPEKVSAMSRKPALDAVMNVSGSEAAWQYIAHEPITLDTPSHASFVWFNDWKDSIVLDNLGLGAVGAMLPRTFRSWLRNFVAGSLLYYVVGFGWYFVVYRLGKDRFFKGQTVASWEQMKQHIIVSQKALVWYTAVPTVSEWVVERGYTMAYFSIWDYSLPMYIAQHVLLLIFVEFCIYWIHRGTRVAGVLPALG